LTDIKSGQIKTNGEGRTSQDLLKKRKRKNLSPAEITGGVNSQTVKVGVSKRGMLKVRNIRNRTKKEFWSFHFNKRQEKSSDFL